MAKISYQGKTKRKYLPIIGCILVFIFAATISNYAFCARLKDIASIEGVRSNQLVGYGLVVGLDGTGDGTQAQFTTQAIVNMMERMGINVDPDKVKVKNVASVMVTAQLPPFAKVGQKIDVLVSSIGDAKSLQGGTLLLTPLRGVDGKIYALAQGPISIGGFAASGAGASVQKNHPTVGRIPNGATVEATVPVDIDDKKDLKISLNQPDFTTVVRAARAINKAIGIPIAKAIDAETISVKIPPKYWGNAVGLIARIENVKVTPDIQAKVVVDERTGTVVMGENVRISEVAIAHGNLSIQIKENPMVSQPAPLSNGQTVVTPNTQIKAKEGGGKLILLKPGATIGQLVRALNAVGVTPRDLIAILQAIKAAGALQADLVII